MGDIAHDAGVHPVHLARQFRRYFGCAPADYVRQRRVELAALLVRTTPRPLAEIAYACGFVDQSHLNRAFVKTFATSPAAYRRRHVSRIQDRVSAAWDSEACVSSPLLR
jgi:AraC family transcriptional regulator